jgi:hypothetical protein
MARPSEPAARKLIAGLRSGNPDYESLAKDLADTIRRMQPFLHEDLVNLGELRSFVFVSVGARGEDVFDAGFENGKRRIEVLLDDTGRIERAMMQPR